MLTLDKLYTDENDNLNNFVYSMNNNSFLSWFLNRVSVKYQESNIVIKRLKNILLNNKKDVYKVPSSAFVEQMCQKYYPDFNMEKDDDLKWGHTDQERENIRVFIKEFYIDVMEYTN